jgi:lysozyme
LVDKDLLGVDVSKANCLTKDGKNFVNQIDWQKLKAQGVKFAYVKLSEGEAYQDPGAIAQAKEILAAGILLGFYHFFRASKDPEKQATNHYQKVCNALAELRQAGYENIYRDLLASMFDLEPVYQMRNGVTLDVDHIDQLPKGEYAKRARACLEEYRLLSGKLPLAYLYPAFGIEQGLGLELGNTYPLWIANYGKAKNTAPKAPKIPKGFGTYAVWQWTGSGVLDGSPNAIDKNWVQPKTLDFFYPGLSARLKEAQ